jgi:hypothetical protein
MILRLLCIWLVFYSLLSPLMHGTMNLKSIFYLGARWEWLLNSTLWPLYSWERDLVPILEDAGWTSRPVWTGAGNIVRTGILSGDHLSRSESL